MKNTIRTVCQGCHSECGVLVEMDGDKITRIKGDPNHPSTKGYICVKGINYAQFVFHPDRIKYPMKQMGGKGEGKWIRLSWDEALDEIAAKFTNIKDEFGVKSIGVFHGTAPRQALYSTRLLAAALGTPNVVNTDLHICLSPSLVAEFATIGCSVTQEHGPDYVNSKCIFMIGSNPILAHPPRGMDVLRGRKNGAKLIVADPRRTKLAQEADLWLRLRPGTAAALLLGMLHIIIEEELYDKEFVKEYCYGFDPLVERIQDYSPHKVSEITWVSAEDIAKAAHMYANTKPAVLSHRLGLDQDINSTQSNRALVILAAITNNLGIKGGNLLPTHIPGYVDTGKVFAQHSLPPEKCVDRLGAQQYPLISGTKPLVLFVHSALAAQAMLGKGPYPLKALYLAGGNPVINMQNSRRTWEALKNLDLLVVGDFFMTPTAELADFVLPATTWLERDECCEEQYMNCIAARQMVVPPRHESRDDIEMVIDLVGRIPWADRKYMPWSSAKEFNDYRLKDTGMSFDQFKDQGYISVELETKQYQEKGFNTPTGKVELYSTIFENNGYEPLPYYIEPTESPVRTPELTKQYPYILFTGGRNIEYYHSAGQQIDILRKRRPEPEIDLHPDTARRESLQAGDWIWLETPQIKKERVRFKVRIDDGIDPRTIHAQHSWWFPEKPGPDHGCFESNINVVLSDDEPREPICGSVNLRATLCRIYK